MTVRKDVTSFIDNIASQIIIHYNNNTITFNNELRIKVPRNTLEFQYRQIDIAEYLHQKILNDLKTFDIRVRYSITHLIARKLLIKALTLIKRKKQAKEA